MDLDDTGNNFVVLNFKKSVHFNDGTDTRPYFVFFQAAKIFGKPGRDHGQFIIGHINGTGPIPCRQVDGIIGFNISININDMDSKPVSIFCVLKTYGIIKIKGGLPINSD